MKFGNNLDILNWAWPYPKGHSYLIIKPMTTPQNVSSRYTRNLLASGSNMHFEVDVVEQKLCCTPENIPVGFYYRVSIKRKTSFEAQGADGATPEAAARHALEKHGVTFA